MIENRPSAPAPGVYTPPQERSTHGRSLGAAEEHPRSKEHFEPVAWEARLRAAVEQTLAARAARKAERQEFKRRRDFGLEARYREKTARNQQEAAVPDGVPPCCEGLDEPCPQHQQAARVVRHQGPRSRSYRPGAPVPEHGKARPARGQEER